MSETLTVGLTQDQRELLLQGLRFVRSSVQLEITDPEPQFVADRRRRIKEIDSLVDRLGGCRTEAAAEV